MYRKYTCNQTIRILEKIKFAYKANKNNSFIFRDCDVYSITTGFPSCPDDRVRIRGKAPGQRHLPGGLSYPSRPLPIFT